MRVCVVIAAAFILGGFVKHCVASQESWNPYIASDKIREILELVDFVGVLSPKPA